MKLHKMQYGLFEDDLITNMFNAKERLKVEKGIKTFKNSNIKNYCENKINKIGLEVL